MWLGWTSTSFSLVNNSNLLSARYINAFTETNVHNHRSFVADLPFMKVFDYTEFLKNPNYSGSSEFVDFVGT